MCMQDFISSARLVLLLTEASNLETWVDGTGVVMAYDQQYPIPRDGGHIERAIRELEAIRGLLCFNLMVNTLLPGTTTGRHIDPGPRHERWHLPLLTNDSCTWWDRADGHIKMVAGRWWGPVPYWLEHEARNDGETPRVHIVATLSCITSSAK